jgi:medium-chain acyl-[acyl-carrier-protein] hydrolase
MHRPASPLVVGGQVSDFDRRWLKRYGRRGEADGILLLCFHHAGGSAAAFRKWPELISPVVEPVAVQLPGRADRFNEPAFDHMAPLVDALVDVITPLLDRPFACYGVSMGAHLAWSLALALRRRAMPMPIQLFLGCEPAPVHDDGARPWENRPDGLEGYLRDLGGTPPEVLAEPELVRALLPTLRADLTALTTAADRPATPLDVPIRAFAGTEDPVAPPALMDGWRAETSARFELDVIPGGHFFDPAGERRVIAAIGDDLGRAGPLEVIRRGRERAATTNVEDMYELWKGRVQQAANRARRGAADASNRGEVTSALRN